MSNFIFSSPRLEERIKVRSKIKTPNIIAGGIFIYVYVPIFSEQFYNHRAGGLQILAFNPWNTLALLGIEAPVKT